MADQGAPLEFGGQNIVRLADLNNQTLASGSYVTGTPTGPRTYLLPALSTVSHGSRIEVQNAGTFTITITASGTDQVDDAGAPGDFSLIPGETVTLEAKLASGGTAGSWFSAAPQAGAFMLSVRPTTQSANIGVGDQIAFTSILSFRGTDISMSLVTGIFTLQVGRTYILQGNLGTTTYSGIGAVSYQWFNLTDTAPMGVGALQVSAANTSQTQGSPIAYATITPTVETTVELRILAATLLTDISDDTVNRGSAIITSM